MYDIEILDIIIKYYLNKICFNTGVRRDMTISTSLICLAVLVYILYLVERVK